MAAGTESHSTRLATERLDALAAPMRSITDQGVDLRVGDVIVRTAAVGTSEGLRINPFGRTAAAFDRGPGRHGRTGRQESRRGRCLLAAERARIGRTRLQQPCDLEARGAGLAAQLPTPGPRPPDQTQPKQQHTPAYIGHHGRSHKTVAERKGLAEGYGGQLVVSTAWAAGRGIIHRQ
jgi:hypothetical protein